MQLSITDIYPDTWCGKTYPEPCQATTEKTSEPSLKKRQGSPSRMPLFLDLTASGATADALWEDGGALLGEYTMRSFGESPKEGVESRLSQILQDDPLPKYCLSEKACQGILNRANRRGKELPKELKEALEAQATPSRLGGGCEVDSYGRGAGKGPLIQEEKSATLGVSQDQTLFAFGIGSYESNAMKSDNPHSGIYEAETARTLDNNGGSPACNQGGVAIVQAVDARNGVTGCVNGTLQAKSNGGYNTNSNNIVIDKR